MTKFFGSTAAAIVAFAGVIAGPALAAPDVTGTWDVVEETPKGDMQGTLMIKDAGDGYKGTFKAQGNTSKLRNIMVKGDKVMFDRTVKTPGGSLDLSYTATVEGDKIKGKVDAGDFGTIPFTGTRQ